MADGRAVFLPVPRAVTLRPEDGNARAAVLEHSVFQLPVFGVVVAKSGAGQQHEMAAPARCGASPGRHQTDCSWRESRPEARAPGSAPCGISGAAISLRNIGRIGPALLGGYRVRRPDRG